MQRFQLTLTQSHQKIWTSLTPPKVLKQLKRRLANTKSCHSYLEKSYHSNPFKLIPKQYGEKVLSNYYEHVFLRKDGHEETLTPHQLLHHAYPSQSRRQPENTSHQHQRRIMLRKDRSQ